MTTGHVPDQVTDQVTCLSNHLDKTGVLLSNPRLDRRVGCTFNSALMSASKLS